MPLSLAPLMTGALKRKKRNRIMGRVKCGLLLKFIHIFSDEQGVRPFSIGDCIDWLGSKMGASFRGK